MKKLNRKKKEPKKPVGRPTERLIDPIPDTAENVARALFGIKSDNPDIDKIRQQERERVRNAR